MIEPSKKPSSGDTKIKTMVLKIPDDINDPTPALAMAAPTMPPINACDELLGIPQY